jgi:squalene synthase HpnC
LFTILFTIYYCFKFVNLTFKCIINCILDEAYKYCEAIAKSHYENFPVASFFIPKDKRKYIYSIYAFARMADDIADSEFMSGEDKLEKLEYLNKDLLNSYKNIYNVENEERKKIFIALSNTSKELNIPVTEFNNLLIAFKQDAKKKRYGKFDELIEYSKYSANPIGHLVLNTFGYHIEDDDELFKLSDCICTGLQLINFWQDISRDIEIDRIYIPIDDMNKFNYSEELLRERIENKNFIDLISSLVNNTKKIFMNGKGIEKKLSGRLKMELKTIYTGGMEIINKIEKSNYCVLSNRVKISNFDKVRLVFKAFI